MPSLRTWLKGLEEDDIGRPDFQQLLLFWGTDAGPIELAPDVVKLLAERSIESRTIEVCDNEDHFPTNDLGFATAPLPAGPYLWRDQLISPIFRLYEDSKHALLDALQPVAHRSDLERLTPSHEAVTDSCEGSTGHCEEVAVSRKPS